MYSIVAGEPLRVCAASTRVVGSGIVMRRHVGGTAFATLCTNMKPYLAHLRGRLESAGATLVVSAVAIGGDVNSSRTCGTHNVSVNVSVDVKSTRRTCSTHCARAAC